MGPGNPCFLKIPLVLVLISVIETTPIAPKESGSARNFPKICNSLFHGDTKVFMDPIQL